MINSNKKLKPNYIRPFLAWKQKFGKQKSPERALSRTPENLAHPVRLCYFLAGSIPWRESSRLAFSPVRACSPSASRRILSWHARQIPPFSSRTVFAQTMHFFALSAIVLLLLAKHSDLLGVFDDNF